MKCNKMRNIITYEIIGLIDKELSALWISQSYAARSHIFIFLWELQNPRGNPRVWLEETLSNSKDYRINDLEELLPRYQKES